MFEDRSYEKLMTETLAMAPEGIDTRQGSIFYDAVSATVNKIAKLYTDLDRVFEIVFIVTATGEYLDLKAAEYAMSRNQATPAKYIFAYTGNRPAAGWRFFHQDSGFYFTLREDEKGTLYLEAEEPGTACNYIQSGDIAVPCNTVQGMTSAAFGDIYGEGYGTDTEDDEHLRSRVLEKIAGPAENGNRQHYKTWCESVDGVGRAIIFPLWYGENTVKAVLVSPDGLPVADGVVDEVQRYIDPADQGMTVEVDGKTYVFGDGYGNGVANVGAHFTAVAATPLYIKVSFRVEMPASQTLENVTSAVSEAVTEYLKNLVLDAKDDETIIVRISAIGAILSGLSAYLVDYSNLLINDAESNIRLAADEVPVLGEVSIHVLS
jgi:uncharacterized phage protein gp47/JayE